MAWRDYYRHLDGRKPRPLFLDALRRFNESPVHRAMRAIDLGSGDGTETLLLLEKGWRVLAVDQEADAIARLEEARRPEWTGVLEVRVAPFEGITLPRAEFIYSGYSLPFCSPAAFPALWAAILEALVPGGMLAGDLFGERDSWSDNADMSFHTAEAVDSLLEPLKVEFLEEEERDGESFSGPKHWHVHRLIARKR